MKTVLSFPYVVKSTLRGFKEMMRLGITLQFALVGGVMLNAFGAPRAFGQNPGAIQQFRNMIMIDGPAINFRLGNGVPYAENPVVRSEYSWEDKAVYMYGTVTNDSVSSDFKMWYKAISGTAPSTKICYAVSPDGLHWSKPIVGLHPFGGSTENNIVLPANAAATMYIESFSVIQNKPEVGGARFTAFFTHGPGIPDEWSRRSHFYRAVSNDGMAWRRDPDSSLQHVTDEVVSIAAHKVNDSLMILTRARDGSRTPMVSKSRDGSRWTEPRTIVRNEDLRLNSVVSYWTSASLFGDTFLGLMGLYNYSAGTISPILIWSTDDGESWTLPDPRESALRYPEHLPVIPAMVFAPSDPFLRVGEEIRLYVSAFTTRHGDSFVPGSSSISLVRWKSSRFLGVGTSHGPSEMLVWKKITGSEVTMEAEIGPEGFIEVGLVAVTGNFIPGFHASDFEVVSDGETSRLAWRGTSDLSQLTGKNVGFLFRMKDATLFELSGVEEAPQRVYRTGILPIPSAELKVNYPNPFNGGTTIAYKLRTSSRVRIDIFNQLGEVIKTLVDEVRSAGQHEAFWEPLYLASGVYFCRLEIHEANGAATKVIASKLLYIK